MEKEDWPREEISVLAESSTLRSEDILRVHSTLDLREDQRRSFVISEMTGARQWQSEAREKRLKGADDGGADTGE